MSKEFFNDVSSNFVILQVIKAADQLYYKDKTLYTAIKPELIRSDTNRPKDAEKHQQIQKSGKKTADDNSGKKAAENLKQNNAQQAKNVESKCSKLQEMIGQAKKTVENALGSSHGSLESHQNSIDFRQEVAEINSKCEDLANLLNALEKRLRTVEKLTEGIAKKIGYSS
ncbi:hypothetical protein niasHT_003752 [Heterodera trifolii]|uniref:Uncharacterized protein n=1 Tax=Heterodera trifolii TaxID=157864 RepID=A0ABD2LUW1_9BILA